MAKKKQFVTAAAAFAVAASAVAPAITADAASTTVRLSSDYVRGGDLDAALDKEYKGSEIYWYKSSIDMNKLGVFQTAKGFVKGKGIKVEKKLRVLNYAQEIKPESEFVFEQGVPVSGIRIQPVLFADGNEYAKPLSVAGFNTDKVGEFEGTLTYANKAYGTVTKTVKYKVVASKVAFSEVKHEVEGDMLSVSADVKNLKEGEKVELVIFPGKDESAALPAIEAEIKDGKVMASAKDIPAGTHSFILRSGDVKTAAMEFKVEKLELKEVKAVAANKLEVAFSQAIDFSKAKIEVKRGTVVVNATVVPSEDKMSAKLELASKLFEGDYTVSVSGLSDEALTKTVSVMNEKVASIELGSTTAPAAVDKKSAKVGYKVMNQYGEDITAAPLASGIDWTASNGVTATDDNKGVLTLTAAEIKKGDMIALTGINASTNTVISKVITIADVAVADSLAFDKVYHADNKELSGSTPATEFALLVDAKDQYGTSLTADQVNEGFIFTSSNPSVLTLGADPAASGLGADKKAVGLKFTAGANYAQGGKVIITAISKATGKVSQYEVNVAAAPALATFNISAPSTLVAAGETVEIPFSAVDQFGKAITKYDDINGKVNFSSNKLKLVKGKDGVAVLEYTAGAKGLDVQVVTVPASGKVSQLSIDVKEAAYAATIESLKDVNTTVAAGGTVDIKLANLVVKDQYGRTMDLKDKLASSPAAGKYRVVAIDADGGAGAVNVSPAEITANDGVITISGSSKGTEEVTFKLQEYKAGTPATFVDVVTSPLKVTFTTVDKSAYTSFEIADVATLYTDGSATTHKQDLKVYGVKADGSKVLLPASYYTVITDTKELVYADGKLNSVLSEVAGADTTKTSKVTVVVDGEKSPVTLMKDVTLSDVAPKAETIEFKKNTVVDGVAKFAAAQLASTTDATALKAILEVTDQYGVKFSEISPVLTVTNLVDNTDPKNDLKVDPKTNGTTSVDIQAANATDTFVVTYLLDGKTVTVKGLVDGTPQ
ncbi:hypothetical protein [Exiguobacterium sp. s196]|uniref:hypothetical protein n=1 Tax=Exiguobacterium sp. s196 TaxID=2751283 RepID=UPI00203610C5|nr:hypothetical protein [Exiguobacterium sp. s196]